MITVKWNLFHINMCEKLDILYEPFYMRATQWANQMM